MGGLLLNRVPLVRVRSQLRCRWRSVKKVREHVFGQKTLNRPKPTRAERKGQSSKNSRVRGVYPGLKEPPLPPVRLIRVVYRRGRLRAETQSCHCPILCVCRS